MFASWGLQVVTSKIHAHMLCAYIPRYIPRYLGSQTNRQSVSIDSDMPKRYLVQYHRPLFQCLDCTEKLGKSSMGIVKRKVEILNKHLYLLLVWHGRNNPYGGCIFINFLKERIKDLAFSSTSSMTILSVPVTDPLAGVCD